MEGRKELMMGMRSLVKRKNVGRLFLHGVGHAGPGVSRFILQPWTLAMEGPPFNKLDALNLRSPTR